MAATCSWQFTRTLQLDRDTQIALQEPLSASAFYAWCQASQQALHSELVGVDCHVSHPQCYPSCTGLYPHAKGQQDPRWWAESVRPAATPVCTSPQAHFPGVLTLFDFLPQHSLGLLDDLVWMSSCSLSSDSFKDTVLLLSSGPEHPDWDKATPVFLLSGVCHWPGPLLSHRFVYFVTKDCLFYFPASS